MKITKLQLSNAVFSVLDKAANKPNPQTTDKVVYPKGVYLTRREIANAACETLGLSIRARNYKTIHNNVGWLITDLKKKGKFEIVSGLNGELYKLFIYGDYGQ